jgi:4-amino-4-deoxy-L-arabinose transferase-like glycosyltransferase
MDASLSLAAIRSNRICLALFLATTFFYLLCSHLVPITDPVEANYALTAKEMVNSSNWLSPQIYGQVWFDKPIMFYWLTALCFKVFGVSDFAARLMPALFAGCGVVLMYWFLQKAASQSAALLSVLVLATSLEYVLLAKFVITDMVLFVFNSAALVFFYLGYIRAGATTRWYLPMYLGMALAVLTKGPVGILLPGLVILAFLGLRRNLSECKSMYLPVGLLLFLLVALPWYAAMYYEHGAKFLDTFLGVHNYLRATVSEHPKDNVFYYYALVFLLGMLPWAPLTAKSIFCRRNQFGLFLLIWTGVYFIFYSLMATKYLTYTFPALFPLAASTGIYLDELICNNKKSTILYWVGIPIAATTLLYVAATYYYYRNPWLFAAGLLIIINIAAILWKIRMHSVKYILGLLCVLQAAAYILLSCILFPALADTRSEKELAQSLREYSAYQVGFYNFYSTSAVYYSGKTATRVISPENSYMPDNRLSWSSKYTMPTALLTQFAAASENSRILIVPKEQNHKLLAACTDRNLLVLKTTDRFIYYYLAAGLQNNAN